MIAISGWAVNNLIINLSQGLFDEILIALPILFSLILPLYLHHLGKYDFSKISFLSFVSLSVVILYINAGQKAYYEIIFVLLFALAIILFKTTKGRGSMIAFISICYLFAYLYTSQYGALKPDKDLTGVFEVVFIVIILALFIVSYKTVNQINSFSNFIQRNVLIEKENLELIAHNNNLLNKQKEEIKSKNDDIEFFFSMSSKHLFEPTKQMKLLSHDLKNSFSENGSQFSEEILDIIEYSAERMHHLVSSINDYSQINENRIREKLDTTTIVKAISKNIQRQNKEIEMLIQVAQLPTILANEREIRILFEQLLSNCINFRKNSGLLEIEINVDDFPNYWKFSVKDNGIGIDKNHQSNIFKMFHKLQNQKDSSSTGIGLPICKKIVNLYDGNIWVDSNLDEGATFYFTLKKYLM